MDGIVIVYKEKGYTSHDVVYKVKKLFNEKVGHTGTLDPLAEGVLPVLVGKGTLTSKYLINHDKKYIATIQLGKKTDTADEEGNVIEELPVDEKNFDSENINKVLHSFLGIQDQTPPIYSAIKINGKKLYEYARKGEKIKIQPRKIEIYDINLIDYSLPKKQIIFEVYCGKGTYIRALCENIAESFGTCGYMKSLERTQVGSFSLDDCVTIDELEKNIDNVDFLNKKIISIEKLFSKNESIHLNNNELKLFLNGVKLPICKLKISGMNQNSLDESNLEKSNLKIINSKNVDMKDICYACRIYNNGKFIGIGDINNNFLKRNIVI